MKSPTLALVAAAAAVMLSGAANASVVSLSGMTASWYDGNPATNVSYTGNGTVSPKARWGTGGNKSGYNFDIANQPIDFVVPPSPSPNQVLGTFTHLNQPINAGSSITDIRLSIKATVSIDNVAQGGPLEFKYRFDHDETPNGADPCANGGANGSPPNQNGCADKVTATWLSTSDDFVVGLDTYTLNVIGFSLDPLGTNPFDSFWTAEQMDNVAYLVGNVELRSKLPPSEVPVPATLPLVALALAGLYGTRRAKATKG